MKSCLYGSSFVHFFLLTSPPLPPTLSTHGLAPAPVPPSSQFNHGINMMPPSCGCLDPPILQTAEGWHHGFNSMLSCNHPTIWKFMEALKKEHNLIRMQLGRMRQLEEPERRAAKWILYDDRVQKLCDSFNRQTNVVNFLKKVANVC